MPSFQEAGISLLTFLTACLMSLPALAASAQLSADQAKVLADARTQSLEYSRQLPNFICTQITYREITGFNNYGASINESRIVSADRIEEKLTYFQHQESYEVVAMNARKVTGVQHTQVAGAVSAGEFGSLRHDVFDPASKTTFQWERMEKLRGRKAYVFAFQVPISAGIQVSDLISNQETAASYRGLIFVDAETKQVVRMTTHVDLPARFAMKLAENLVDYRSTEIAGKTYDLPFHSEVRMQDDAHSYTNKIDFKGYHKFAVESTITYGEAPPLPPQASMHPSDADSSMTAALKPTPAPAPAPSPLVSEQQAAKVPAAQSPAEPLPPAAATPSSPTVNAAASAIPAQATSAPPVAREQQSNFQLQVKVDEVLVPVVVRDAQNHAVGDLTKDDFDLFDRNKRQDISSFSVEAHTLPARPDPAETSAQPNERKPANNFIAYLFDDVHLAFGDLVRVRDAASHSMDTLLPTDRAAIFTTSGRLMLDFTGNRALLHDALSKLRPHPLAGLPAQDCPDISAFMANQIMNVFDPMVAEGNPPLQAAIAETMTCLSLQPRDVKVAQDQAVAKARSVLAISEHESRTTLLTIKQVVQSIALAPGTKAVILITPGFNVNGDLLSDQTALADEAIRDGIVISALDARGVYTMEATSDMQKRSANANATRIKEEMDRAAAIEDTGVMQESTAATGGTFIQNTNDLAGAFRRLTTPPEYTYLLGFTPKKLKHDGGFHALKVKLAKKQQLTLQARSGFYAPKH